MFTSGSELSLPLNGPTHSYCTSYHFPLFLLYAGLDVDFGSLSMMPPSPKYPHQELLCSVGFTKVYGGGNLYVILAPSGLQTALIKALYVQHPPLPPQFHFHFIILNNFAFPSLVVLDLLLHFQNLVSR